MSLQAKLCPILLDAGWIDGQVPERLDFRMELDLTGYTIVLQLQQPDGTVINKSATLDTATPTESTFHVDFLASDSVEGIINARIRFTTPTSETYIAGEFGIKVEGEWV